MLKGIVFDIKEFAIHDGPGIRTTVFLKGCPLSCKWCHNPEGQSQKPEVMRSPTGERKVGQSISSSDLARLLNRQAVILNSNEGGVTFSGGEPLMQAAFVAEVIDQLNGLHVLLDTCGYGSHADFKTLLHRVSMVYYDLKLIDPEAHLQSTGKSNALILQNLIILSESNVPYVIRIPLIPGVTDTSENLGRIAHIIKNLPGLLEVNLLPYNRAAGAKYQPLGRKFELDISNTEPVRIDTSAFTRNGIKVRVA